LRDILRDKGILHYFDPLIISAEVGVEKPNPAIFRLGLERAGLAAHEVLYVGDHETNDVWAPGRVGIASVRIKRYPYQEGEGITSLAELFASAG
jgi:putative hydrolase of the HAD superfamily